jgi:hypothetical protein
MVLVHTRLRDNLAATSEMDSHLLQAICEHESNDTSFATRYEPHLARSGWHQAAVERFGLDVDDWRTYASMGPMQILCVNVYDLGYTGTIGELFGDPEHSLRYGARHLYRQVRRYDGAISQALSAYNAGSATARNVSNYVEPILARYKELRPGGGD